MSLIKASGAGEQSTGFYKLLLDQSLKFNDDDAQYLSRTPASAGNRRTFTFSCWVKRSNLGEQAILDAYSDDSNRTRLMFDAGNRFQLFTRLSGADHSLICNAVSRDCSAWQNVVFAVDTTQSTASDRVKIYINGESQTFTGSGFPDQNEDTFINHTVAHSIGSANDSGGREIYYDGYLAEINMIDGTALTAASFGETKNGIWIPKNTSGLTFGTNGFHLTFKDDVVSEGFNAVTWRGSAADNSISGIGFSPAFVWIKDRTDVTSHYLFDVNRGALKDLYSNLTNAEYSASQTLKSFDADGFTVGNNTGVNGSADDMVAWCWEGGGTPTATNSAGAGATPTAGSVKIDGSNLGSALAGTIPATKISANTARGFSIVGYEATGTAGTIAHGLSAALEFIIIKHRDQAGAGWPVYFGDNTDVMYLGENYATGDDANAWNDTSPTSTVFSVGPNGGDTNNSLGGSTIAYCFHSVSSYSKFGSFTGNGGSQAIDVGFAVAWVLLKRTNSSSWAIFDNTRQPANTGVQSLFSNTTGTETTNANMVFSGNTFNDNGYVSDNGETVIYMAFADTREARFFADVSSNGNHFTPVNLDYRDSVPDVPTNNFATFNPLDAYAGATTFSEGNLKGVTTSGGTGRQTSTIRPASGKWYAEFYVADASRFAVGIENGKRTNSAQGGNDVNSVIASYNGQYYYNGSGGSYMSSLSNGDIVQVAMDVDNQLVFIGINNTWQNSATASEIVAATATNSLGAKVSATAATLFQDDMGIFTEDNSGSAAMASIANFGQDSSFAGNHATANSNADGNGHGSFAYAPPSGFLALCSQNLPDAAIIDGTENFNTVLYTGNASTNAITGVGFSPDWVWTKSRGSGSHSSIDAVRGRSKMIFQNLTNAEATSDSDKDLVSFDSDGFTLGANQQATINNNSQTFVAWNWLAGTAFSNSSGSNGANVDSSGQVNTTAGFSIVSWQYTTSADNLIAHGLSSAPEMMIVKSRTTAYNWDIYHTGLSDPTSKRLIFTNGAEIAGFFDTNPTSTVFEYNTSAASNNDNMIAYCFHSVLGFSAVGSYTGNNGTTFVNTGFRVAWLLIKSVSQGSGANWGIFDNTRPDGTGATSGVKFLQADLTNAEGVSSTVSCFFFSNGFEIGTSNVMSNSSGDNFIYLAFADQPFKFSNAR